MTLKWQWHYLKYAVKDTGHGSNQEHLFLNSTICSLWSSSCPLSVWNRRKLRYQQPFTDCIFNMLSLLLHGCSDSQMVYKNAKQIGKVTDFQPCQSSLKYGGLVEYKWIDSFYGSLTLVYWPHLPGSLLFYLFGLKWVGHQCYRIFPTISGTVFKPHNSVLSNTENKPVYWPHPCINHSLFNRSRLKNEMPYSGASATNNLKVLWSRDGHFKQKYYTQSLHQYTQTQL